IISFIMFELRVSQNYNISFTDTKATQHSYKERAGENFPARFSQQIRGQTLQFCKVCPFLFQTDVGVYEHLKIITNN
ncbi:hypothetical protein, partial [Alistipes finegoldii]|uniref:hypothetical protein n=1 Tax=Alistipes finegoldii TaxID=214856 RepID=UPI003AB60E53